MKANQTQAQFHTVQVHGKSSAGIGDAAGGSPAQESFDGSQDDSLNTSQQNNDLPDAQGGNYMMPMMDLGGDGSALGGDQFRPRRFNAVDELSMSEILQ